MQAPGSSRSCIVSDEDDEDEDEDDELGSLLLALSSRDRERYHLRSSSPTHAPPFARELQLLRDTKLNERASSSNASHSKRDDGVCCC